MQASLLLRYEHPGRKHKERSGRVITAVLMSVCCQLVPQMGYLQLSIRALQPRLWKESQNNTV